MLQNGVSSEDSGLNVQRQVLICQHQSCKRHGAEAVLAAFEQHPIKTASVECTSCQGQCNIGPTVRILPDETWYYRVQPEDVPQIVEQHLQQGKPVTEKLNPRIHFRYQY